MKWSSTDDAYDNKNQIQGPEPDKANTSHLANHTAEGQAGFNGAATMGEGQPNQHLQCCCKFSSRGQAGSNAWKINMAMGQADLKLWNSMKAVTCLCSHNQPEVGPTGKSVDP